MPDDATGRSFYDRVVEATPGGETLALCLQCGTCGGSCPSGPDMDATPRRIFAMVASNMEDEVLDSNTPWMCVSCYYCTVRCPQEIPITDLMYTLKRMAVARGRYSKDSHADFSNSFIGYVEQYGRSFEFGLVTRYHLFHHPLSSVRKSGLGFEMLTKGRLSPSPERIKNMPQLTAILKEAKRIAAQEEM
jgi:heterodisulfide reductase subunit C